MPSVNFSKFIDKVESGEKPCTIRASRKVPFKVGDALYLYTGMRQTGARRLIRKPVKCREAFHFLLIQSDQPHMNDVEYMVFLCPSSGLFQIDDTTRLTDDQVAKLAKLDGFSSVLGFIDYFLDGKAMSFMGQLIHWKHPARKFVPLLERLE